MWFCKGYKTQAAAMNYFRSNATYKSNATQDNAHAHERVDEPATEKKHQIDSYGSPKLIMHKNHGYTIDQK